MDQDLLNPYDPGNPVENPDYFFGRKEVLEELHRNLQSREQTPIVIMGPRRIGKSTILHQLKREAPEFEYVRIDPFESGFDTIEELLQEWARELGTLTGEDLICEGVDEESFQDRILPTALKTLRDQGRDLVCLFDELSQMEEFNEAPEPAETRIMRYLYQVHRRHKARMVFVATWPLGTLSGELLKGEKRVRVGNFSFEESEELIREPAKNYLAYSDGAITEIFDITGGNPHAIQVLCSCIWNKFIEPNRIYPIAVRSSEVGQVFPKAAEDASAASVAVWLWFGDPLHKAILSFVASAQKDYRSFCELSHDGSELGLDLDPRELGVARRELLNLELLKCDPSGNRVRLANELFRRWIAEQQPWDEIKGEFEPDAPSTSLLRMIFEESRKKFDGYRKQGDVASMKEIVDAWKEHDPHSDEAQKLEQDFELYSLFTQARTAHRHGKWAEARDYWRQMLQNDYDYDRIHIDQLIVEAGKFLRGQGGLGVMQIHSTLRKLQRDEFRLSRLRGCEPFETKLELTNEGDCSAWGQVDTSRLGSFDMVPWLDVPEPDFFCLPGEKITVTINVQPSKWRWYSVLANPKLILNKRKVPPEQIRRERSEQWSHNLPR